MLHLRLLTFLLLCTLGSSAQLCQGSLGDPIVNITFGAGNNPGGALAAAATNYQYQTADCPNDGFYTLRNNTQSCYGGCWHTVNSDHTGDANGFFMMVNASVQPSAFYVDTVRNLCASTTYEFAAWFLNLIRPGACQGTPNDPNITFTLLKTDGSVISTYTSGNIPKNATPTWQQFGFFFTTPANVQDVILRITNNAPGGNGNDLLLDDITFRPCGPTINASISGVNNDTANICTGTAANFTFSCPPPAGFTNPEYQWQQSVAGGAWQDIAGQNQSQLTRNFTGAEPAGIYAYRMGVKESGNQNACRVYSDVVAVQINASPTVTAQNNGPVCEKQSLTLSAAGAANYTWTGPNNYTASGSSVIINPVGISNAGTYTVTGTSSVGCIATATTMVVVNNGPAATVAAKNIDLCAGDSATLSAAGGSTYSWQPVAALSAANQASVKASPQSSTKYTVTVGLANGCTDTASTLVTIFPKAIPSAGPDLFTVANRPVRLQGSISGSYQSFSWQPAQYLDNPTALTPLASPVADTRFILEVTSNNNCGVLSDTMFVKFYNGIYIPSAFTPNGDAINSTWNIPSLNAFPDFVLRVYNRYGQPVFENRGTNKPWTGMFKGYPLPAGNYVYVITYDGGKVLKGSVLLIR